MDESKRNDAMKTSGEHELSVRSKDKKDDNDSAASKSVSEPAGPSRPPLPIYNFKKLKNSKHYEIESVHFPIPPNAAASKVNGSMQPPQSRTSVQSALSPEDAVRPAATSGNGSKVKRDHCHITEIGKTSSNPPSRSMGCASTKEEQPEPLITSARRIPPVKKPRQKHNIAESFQKTDNTITLQSPPEKAHDRVQIGVHSELTAAEQDPKKERGIGRGVRSQIATQPVSKKPGYLRGTTPVEDSQRESHDPTNLCTPVAALGQGRQERTPRPKEMTGLGGFKPTNRLNATPGSTFLGAANPPRKNLRESSIGDSPNAFDLRSPTKRRRLESYASSTGSVVLLTAESGDHSDTARSEPLSGRKSVGNKEQKNSRVYGAVSQSSEFNEVEALVNPDLRQKKRRSLYPSSLPAKKQCLEKDKIPSKAKVSRRLEDKQQSNMGNSSSIERDEIQEVSPIWRGTAKPSGSRTQNGMSTTRGNPAQSRYFGQQSRTRATANTSSHMNANRNQGPELEIEDSEDELAGPAPIAPSKEQGARSKGASILAGYSLKSRDDIPKTNFRPSKSGKTKASEISFGLSSIIAGKLMLKQVPSAWRIVLNRENGVFEPYKDDVSMTDEVSELVVDPKKLRRVFYAEDSKKISIQRRVNLDLQRSRSPTICIELDESSNPEYFISWLGDLGKGSGEFVVEKSGKLENRFNNLWSQTAGRPMPKPIEHEDVKLMETRQQQRRIQSQQNGNRISPATNPPKKTGPPGLFGKVKHSTTIDVDSDDYQEPLASRMTATERPRRTTRAATQDQKAATDTGSKVREISPSPRPGWTDCYPNWRKSWGLQKTQLSYPPVGKDKALVDIQDIERLDEGQFLNDNLIAFYLRFLQERLQSESPEIARNVHFHNTFFYNNLTKGGSTKIGINYDAVKRWTSKVDLFSKEYIVVPVNEDLHWYLAIICNAPALKQTNPEPSSEEKKSCTPAVEQETTDLSGGEPKAEFTRQAAEQYRGDALDQSGNDLPHIEKMTIGDRSDLPGDQIRESSDEFTKNQPVLEESAANETLERAAQPPIILDSQPKSPQRIPSKASSPVIHHNPEVTPQLEEQVNGSSTSNVKRSTSKKNKRGSRSYDTSKAHIIILDSLGLKHPATRSNLRDYLIAEANDKLGLLVEKTSIVGFNMPKDCIPQQDNHCDCGLFLLGYAEQFLKDTDSFVHSLLTTEMHVQTHWGHMDALEMRDKIRGLVFKHKLEQDGIKQLSPKKVPKALANGKDKGPETSGRETSEQSNRSRPSPDSPGQQLRDDQSRPTSSSSQNGTHNPKNQGTHETSQLPGRGRGLIGADKDSALKKTEFPDRKTPLVDTSLTKLGKPQGNVSVSPQGSVPSPSTNKRLRSSPGTQDSPSRRNHSRSVSLDDPVLISRRDQRPNVAQTSRRGSPNDAISLIEDDAVPSSPGTLVSPEYADHQMPARPMKPSPKIRVNVPGTGSPEVPDSQEQMLLDEEERNNLPEGPKVYSAPSDVDEEDDFLKKPKVPSALTDNPPVPGAFPDNEPLNVISAPATSPTRTSGKSGRELTLNSISQETSRPQTYSRKGKNPSRDMGKEVVDLSHD